MNEAWEPWKWQPPINDQHVRYADVRTLAGMTNARQAREEFVFDLDKPLVLRFSPISNWYWWLEGTSTRGERITHQWLQARDNGRTDFRADLDRCLGIEATLNPETALDRLLAAEQRRAAYLKEQNR